MAEFSWTERFVKVALGPALFCVWWYFAPDYTRFFSTPLGQLTVADIAADFARIAGNLYELRSLADYDPSRNFTRDEARVAISDARQAITWFQRGNTEQQKAFLTLLLFKSR